MIYAKIKDASHYLGISKKIDQALAHIINQNYRHFCPGKNTIVGDVIYANQFGYDTLEQNKSFFEAHNKYIDIHVLMSGKEKIAVADINALALIEKDEDSDYIGYQGTPQSFCEMDEESFLILFPEDAHKGQYSIQSKNHVEKAVYKVLLH